MRGAGEGSVRTMDGLLLVGLPYVAMVALVVGVVHRFRTRAFSCSSLSSQFLEDRQLLYGSVPWHIGVAVLLVGHAVALLLPGLWSALCASRAFLIGVEVVGVAAALLALVGLGVLAIRRLTNGRVQAVTTTTDLVVLALLVVQVLLGVTTAVRYPWGASWSPGTVAPYLWSLLLLRPAPEFVADMPTLLKAHLALGWVIIGLVPFSRLIHVLSLPLEYLWRAPQVVIWNNARRFAGAVDRARIDRTRRYFLRGAAGIAAGGSMLAVGVADKLFRFFLGPRMEADEEAELMEKRLVRLRETARQKELELERKRSEYIRVARLGELSDTRGRYFIDYEMRPALAFRGADGLPILISAKCTHLGCTVGSQLDAQGRILCPCHVSFFDVRTGMPNAGAPAKTPLPHLAWVLMDAAGRVIASRGPGGDVEGAPRDLDGLDVYIARSPEEAT